MPTTGQALAFVPDPMPEELDLGRAEIRLLSEADYALGRLAGSAGRLVNPYLIGQPLLRREAILSSRIEGTFTTPEQLVLLEAGVTPPAQDARASEDTREVLNYVHAMERGLELLRTIPVSLRLLREVHGVLLDGVRGGEDQPGQFRTVQNYIGSGQASIAEARFVPPPVAEMQEALAAWERDLHREPDPLPLLVRLAVAHYQFEAIHPFRDGNGRVGRLLIPLLLCAHQRLSDPLLYMSAYFDRHRERYMDLLLRVSTHGAWREWVGFFLQGVAECALDGQRLTDGLLALRERYHEMIRSARSSALSGKLIDDLFRVPSITIGRAAELLEVTPAAASYNLRKLVDLRIVAEVTGRTRGQVFVAREILDFFRKDLGAQAPEA
ncbi:MAG: Fic family protein [Vicinamibacterales bacterium]